ncbi:MAG: hypothetical protein Q7R39_04460 [Dehalococcoidia bacterium]|nr:hypothetical protein [Dehalococcoidia bacterium]
MEHQELVDRLLRLERDIRELGDATDSPAIEYCMREMWTQLFLAKQFAGIWDAICPEELA